jgi:hypothetical protein
MRRQSGAAMMILTVLVTLVSTVAVAGVSRGLRDDRVVTREALLSKQVYFTSESGVEDAVYRHIESMTIGTTEVLTMASTTATTSIQNILDEKHISSSARMSELVRKIFAKLRTGNGASFNFGMQSDTGGIVMQNSSSVIGNAYSNGPIVGGGSSMVRGDIISSGPTGSATGVHATGSVWAHTIQNSTVDKNAYYQSISSTAVGGISYPGSPDQATTSLPIPDSLIEEWKVMAEAGGVITSPCPYTINSDTTIGPIKIQCSNVTMTGNSTDVTFAGPVWIDGNLTLEKATFHIPASLGTKSVQVVVDDPESHATGSKIVVQNSTTFVDDDGGNSYVLLLSRNNSAKNSGTVKAIDLAQSASGKVLVYAAEGLVDLANSVTMKEVTGYRITLGNNTNVQYETGLANLLFSGGPAGGYLISAWNETK